MPLLRPFLVTVCVAGALLCVPAAPVPAQGPPAPIGGGLGNLFEGFTQVDREEVDSFARGLALATRYNDLGTATPPGGEIALNVARFPDVADQLRDLLDAPDPLLLPQVVGRATLGERLTVGLSLLRHSDGDLDVAQTGYAAQLRLLGPGPWSLAAQLSASRLDLDHPDGDYDPRTREATVLVSRPLGSSAVHWFSGASAVEVDGTVTIPAANIRQEIADSGLHLHTGLRWNPGVVTLAAEWELVTLVDASILWLSLGARW